MTGKYEVKVSKEEIEQMKEIAECITWEILAPDAANKLLDEMENTISSLAEMPNRMSLVDEEPWRSEGIRKVIVKNFLIYFWTDDENRTVQVIAVIYGKRDQIEQLRKLKE